MQCTWHACVYAIPGSRHEAQSSWIQIHVGKGGSTFFLAGILTDENTRLVCVNSMKSHPLTTTGPRVHATCHWAQGSVAWCANTHKPVAASLTLTMADSVMLVLPLHSATMPVTTTTSLNAGVNGRATLPTNTKMLSEVSGSVSGVTLVMKKPFLVFLPRFVAVTTPLALTTDPL